MLRLSRPLLITTFSVIALYFTYSVIHNYSTLNTNQCSNELTQLHTQYKEQIATILNDLRKQIEKETELLKKINKKDKEQWNLQATIEKQEQQLKENQSKLLHTEELVAQLTNELEEEKKKKKEVVTTEQPVTEEKKEEKVEPPAEEKPATLSKQGKLSKANKERKSVAGIVAEKLAPVEQQEQVKVAEQVVAEFQKQEKQVPQLVSNATAAEPSVPVLTRLNVPVGTPVLVLAYK